MDATTNSSVSAHERSMLAIIWVFLPFTAVMMAMRFYARYRRRAIGYDDWTMLFNWAIFSVGCGLITAMVVGGGMKHIRTIQPDRLVWINKISVGVNVIGVWTVIGKVAVGLLILRLLTDCKTRWRQHVVCFSIFISIISSIVNTFAIFFMCDPIRAVWDFRLVANGQATCPRAGFYTKISIVQGVIGTWMDFVLALLPATFVFKLKIPLRQKVAICILLGLGVFAGVCVIMRVVEVTTTLSITDDRTYSSYSLTMWAIAENHLVVITGSLAPAKPVFDKIFFGKPIDLESSIVKPSTDSSTLSLKSCFWSRLRSNRSELQRSRQQFDDFRSSLEQDIQLPALPLHVPKGTIITSKMYSVELLERQ